MQKKIKQRMHAATMSFLLQQRRLFVLRPHARRHWYLIPLIGQGKRLIRFTELPPGTPLTNTPVLPFDQSPTDSGRPSTRQRPVPTIYEYQPTIPIVTTTICERCQKKVSDVGSNYLFHLRACDPEFFAHYLNTQTNHPVVSYHD